MNPLISVIVPVYSVEEYLDRCVESIVKQTYTNLEIILVDDGSPDNCPQKCDEWAKKDNRIVVIHKENGGLSDARNKGLEIASGEYIGFIDSDDFISVEFFADLLDVLLKEESDIIECDVVKFYENNCFDEYDDDYQIKSYSTEDALLCLMKESVFHQHVWNKLYKKELIADILFPVGKLNEDEFWTYKVFGNAKRVTKTNKTMYYYFQRKSSIMHVDYSVKRLDGVLALKERLYYINENYPSLSDFACLCYFRSCFYHYQVICRNEYIDPNYKYRKQLYNEFKNHYSKEIARLKPIKQRIWMYCFKLFPNLTCRLRNLLKIGL